MHSERRRPTQRHIVLARIGQSDWQHSASTEPLEAVKIELEETGQFLVGKLAALEHTINHSNT